MAVVCAGCGKVEKLAPDAATPDASVDASVDAPADAAPPKDPLVNGSFEMNYTGWTLAEDSGVPTNGYWGISGSTTFAAGTTVHDFNDNIDGVPSCLNVGTNTVAVADGANAAFNTQGGPERHRIWQDIVLPPEASMLTWSMGYTATSFDPVNEFLAIEVRDPTTDGVVANLFYTDPAMAPPTTQPMMSYAASISAYAGERVRITVDVQAHTNCLFTAIDDFRVTF
jgi:hypothetical protein